MKLHHTATENHMPYGIRLCYLSPGIGDFPTLTQLKLVIDLATPEGCKAELTYVVVTLLQFPNEFTCQETVTCLRNK